MKRIRISYKFPFKSKAGREKQYRTGGPTDCFASQYCKRDSSKIWLAVRGFFVHFKASQFSVLTENRRNRIVHFNSEISYFCQCVIRNGYFLS